MGNVSAAQHVMCFGPEFDFGRIRTWFNSERGRPYVGLALKLDVLVMLTAIVFVSAIVLGAF
jgi:hypothetical protein